eukprot:scaffold2348_cov114-Isochrysis_galbana.AAC.5
MSAQPSAKTLAPPPEAGSNASVVQPPMEERSTTVGRLVACRAAGGRAMEIAGRRAAGGGEA